VKISVASPFPRTVRRRTILGGAAAVCGIVAVIAIVAAMLSAGPFNGRQQGGSAAPGSLAGVSASAPASATPGATAAAPSAAASSAPTLAPVVPVANFWAAHRDIALVDVARLWAGIASAPSETGYDSVAVSPAVASPLAAAFGLVPGEFVRIITAADVRAAVRGSSTTLGLLAPEEVAPDVRALTVEGRSLFGPDRVKALTQWPLQAPIATPTTFSLDAELTIDAGGDVNLDRRPYLESIPGRKGVDFPWSAGRAHVTYYENGGFDGRQTVQAADDGPTGYFAQKLGSTDLTLVNLEGSVPNNWITRDFSLIFTFDPAMLKGMKDAGIDAVTLANNHIRNGGDQGVVDTINNLDAAGIAHTGAGANLTAARQPAWLMANGKKLAVLGYCDVGWGNTATDTEPGGAPMDMDAVVSDIHAARAAGADIVIVMPHWGSEYSYSVFSSQRAQAAAMVAAGADMILGSHSHWVGGIQSFDGPNGPAFVDYSMGDFLFDLTHDASAEQGALVTLTFSGTRLVQVSLDPTIMIYGAQVGLLDPAGDGRGVLNAIRDASRGWSNW
jgi:poly-gamma-glutamate synthesis protein (capsule biosynthesis protein)